MGYAIQRFDNVLVWSQVGLSTSSSQILSALPAYPVGEIMGIQLTNNDSAATVYLGYDNSVSATKFWKKLAPGEYLEELMGRGSLSRVWAIASAGTPNLSVAVMG